MKKNFIRTSAICAVCAASLLTTSCIGNFRLSSRLYGWNKTIGNKFQNELVFFAFWILPVYEFCGLADLIVLNSIEFWTGDNPMASGTKVVEGNDGRYLVHCDGKGYDIESLTDGTTVRLDFDAKDKTWSYTADGESHVLFTFVDDNHMRLPIDAEGNYRDFEISEAGLEQYKSFVSGVMYATR